MDKNPLTKFPELQEQTPKRGKRKRRETLCVDKRRSFDHCGICGSGDLVYEVLTWCKTCGSETFNIALKKLYWRFDWNEIEAPCNCEPITDQRFRFTSYPQHYEERKVCITCGSIEAGLCPSCKKPCWTSPFGEKFCRACGYRHPGYLKEKQHE
jgi:hypothetical protein